MTFSIVARCALTGQFGMAVSSSSPAVAARCAHVRAGAGAVASQNVTDPDLGPLILDRLQAGMPAPDALADVLAGRAHIAYRQLLVIDRDGTTALHSGPNVLGLWAGAEGRDCASGGNLLAYGDVPAAMVGAFETARGHLGDRLMAALAAALAAGGEAGPVRSAGLKIADKLAWPLADLRVDWSDDPIGDLSAVWEIYRPQMADYVQRAIDPTRAPSYAVPGDE